MVTQILNGSVFNINNQVTIPLESTIIQLLLVTAAFAGVGVAIWSARKAHKATERSNKITRDSVDELKESNKLTKESNDLLRKEIEARLRPHFELDFSQHSPQFNTTDMSNIRHRFLCDLKNTGTVPVTSLHFSFNCGNKKPDTLEQLLREKDFWRKRGSTMEFGSISPNRTIVLDSLEFRWQDSQENPLWFCVWIDYEYMDDVKETCIFMLRINGTSVASGDITYYNHAKILKAENNIKNPPDVPIG